MTVAMIARGTCNCGRSFIVFQPEKRELSEKIKTALGEDSLVDVYICDQPEVYCSCGQAISLPIPEELDTDAHDLGIFLEEIEREADSQQYPGDFLEWLKSQE